MAYAINISKNILKIAQNWDVFLENSSSIVDSKLDKLSDWIDELIKSPGLREALFTNKELLWELYTLDLNLDYKIIKEVKKDIKTAYERHIPAAKRIKLLDACNELKLLFNSAHGKREVDKNKKAMIYFKLHPYQFKHIQEDDIKDIIISSEDNAPRNARRKILEKVGKRYGLKLGGSRIEIELGLTKEYRK